MQDLLFFSYVTMHRVLFQVEAKIYFCEPDGACYMQGVVFRLPVKQQRDSCQECEIPVKMHFDCVKP